MPQGSQDSRKKKKKQNIKTLSEVSYIEETYCKFKNETTGQVFFLHISSNHCDSVQKSYIQEWNKHKGRGKGLAQVNALR